LAFLVVVAFVVVVVAFVVAVVAAVIVAAAVVVFCLWNCNSRDAWKANWRSSRQR